MSLSTAFRARVRRRLDRHLDAAYGARCRLGCGQRVLPRDVASHEAVNHAGDPDAREGFYPANDGTAVRYDPTHGRIDRDIQWAVYDRYPDSLGQRVAVENTLQARRNEERAR